MQPIPYLFFTGRCEEAFVFYADIFGTDPVFVRVKGSPMAEHLPPETADKIMHASLRIGTGEINGSDDLGPNPSPPMAGCNVMLSFPDAATSRRHFDALSDGGEVRMPFEAHFGTPGFGAFTDRYGIRWMISTDREET